MAAAMYQTRPTRPRAGPAALALVEASPAACPVSLVASRLQVVALLGRGLSVLGLSPRSHGCKPLPRARVKAAVKPLGKRHKQGVSLAAGTRLTAVAWQHQGATTAMGMGREGWARGFPVNPATAESHGPRNGTDLQSWCMGDAQWLHLLASLALLHVSDTQDMMSEPCMLDPPRRHPRVALALLHVPRTGDGSHACRIHPGQPSVGATYPGAVAGPGGSQLPVLPHSGRIQLQSRTNSGSASSRRLRTCRPCQSWSALLQHSLPHVVQGWCGGWSHARWPALAHRDITWGHLKAPAPTCY